MVDRLTFENRAAFRAWLEAIGAESKGVWLLFGKKGGPTTLAAGEALEEALCFGWIDGQMKSIDDQVYHKYFSPRRANSKWSEKNKALARLLEQQGKMTAHGREKIAEAKANGQWNAPKAPTVTEDQIVDLAVLLQEHETAHANFLAMPPSVQKTYTRAYLDAKTEAGRAKRFSRIVERLNQNLKPM